VQLALTAFKLNVFFSASLSNFFVIITFFVAASISPGTPSVILSKPENVSFTSVECYFKANGGFLLEIEPLNDY